MSANRVEHERPTEWLRQLEEEPARYHVLLNESGSLALAAYRLARARCRAAPVPTGIPTERELYAAAVDVSRRSQTPHPPVAALLSRECEHERLAVIQPI